MRFQHKSCPGKCSAARLRGVKYPCQGVKRWSLHRLSYRLTVILTTY